MNNLKISILKLGKALLKKLKEFIKNRLNDSLKEIGYKKIFKVNKEIINKTDWFDEQLLGNNHTDFFNSRPSEYQKGGQSFNGEDLF